MGDYSLVTYQGPTMNDEVRALRELLPPDGSLPKAMEIRSLAKQVLREGIGTEPKLHLVNQLIASLKRQLRNEAEDAAYFRSMSNDALRNPETQKSQAGGGRRVSRKPGLFGG